MKDAMASTTNLEMRAHWARYICVLVAGLLENALRELYSEHVKRASSGPTANFALSQLKIQNPKADKFLELARCFNPVWEKPLEDFMADNGRKDAIDSIMNIRHKVAHGKEGGGVTFVTIRQYFDKSIEVLEFIEKQVRPS